MGIVFEGLYWVTLIWETTISSCCTKSCCTLRVQVPNNHILPQNMYYKQYYPKPKYSVIGYMGSLRYNILYDLKNQGPTVSSGSQRTFVSTNSSAILSVPLFSKQARAFLQEPYRQYEVHNYNLSLKLKPCKTNTWGRSRARRRRFFRGFDYVPGTVLDKGTDDQFQGFVHTTPPK